VNASDTQAIDYIGSYVGMNDIPPGFDFNQPGYSWVVYENRDDPGDLNLGAGASTPYIHLTVRKAPFTWSQ
jgi:hypothetical protein